MAARFVLGLNQYAHSAAACLVDSEGRVAHALAKERLTRKKHDGGDTSGVVAALLERAGVRLDAIALAVANCHLFRIRPFERDLPWSVALHQQPSSALDACNLLPGVPKHELSHHLAHAWSLQAELAGRPALILVADGIGTTWADLQGRSSASDLGPYTSDADLPRAAAFREVPAGLPGAGTWREAETVYRFDGGDLTCLFKRWTREHSPVLLHNYGFENMESVGAVYSRVASHVFGDWNVCGKVMGLAPWVRRWCASADARAVLEGPLEELRIDWERLRSEPGPNAWGSAAQRAAHTRLAADVQRDLEEVLLEFLTRLRRETGETTLALAGGVALNSTANGRLAREAGFERVLVPPWPGDDGVAVGCALFGHRHLNPNAPTPRGAPAPYLGTSASVDEIDAALDEAAPWIDTASADGAGPAPEVGCMGSDWIAAARGRVEAAAAALARGEVIGWFQGRSEFGPRALGHRSILATPADARHVERINAAVKKREGFRPFAPTVLAERAKELFEGVTPSPWMSLTVSTRTEWRARIPAVVHVDGSARLQTLERGAEPLFHALLEAFCERTGLPLLLNTSLNTRAEPLVESASDAVGLLLDSDLDLLVLEDRLVRRRAFPREHDFEHARPTQYAGFSAQVVSDADGDAVAVVLMAHGRNWEADALELTVLEACDGASSVAELTSSLAPELGMDAGELLDVLRRLYGRQLVHFEAAGA